MKTVMIRWLVPRWMIQTHHLELLVMIARKQKIVPMVLSAKTTRMKVAAGRWPVPRWMIQTHPLEPLVMLACMQKIVPVDLFANTT